MKTIPLTLIAALLGLTANATTVGYWRFDNDTGASNGATPTTAVDETGNNNLTYTTASGAGIYNSDVFGSPVPQTGATNAISYTPSSYNNTDSAYFVDSSPSSALSFGTTDSFTIEGWVKLDTLSNNNQNNRRYLVWKKATGSADSATEWGLMAQAATYQSGGNKLLLQMGGSTYTSSLGIADTTSWHYITAAYDADSDLIRFGLDGTYETVTSVSTGATSGTGDFYLGAHLTSSDSLSPGQGMGFDEVRISNSYLGTSELLYSIPEPSTYAGMLGFAIFGLAFYRRRR